MRVHFAISYFKIVKFKWIKKWTVLPVIYASRKFVQISNFRFQISQGPLNFNNFRRIAIRHTNSSLEDETSDFLEKFILANRYLWKIINIIIGWNLQCFWKCLTPPCSGVGGSKDIEGFISTEVLEVIEFDYYYV